MQILLINLARATERLAKMDARFKAQGLEYTRFAAIDGATITDNERALVNNNVRQCFTPYPLSDNEIGCWLSHRNAMIEILRSGELMAAIVEDDAELQPEFAAVLDAVSKSYLSFDFIFLHRKFKKNEKFVRIKPLVSGIDFGVIAPAHMGAIGYIVSREGARKFVDATPRLVHSVDKEMHRYWANGLGIYGLSRPVVITNDEGHSYIEETRSQENNTHTRSRYADSDSALWRVIRRGVRIVESIRKYSYFPLYLRACKHANRVS